MKAEAEVDRILIDVKKVNKRVNAATGVAILVWLKCIRESKL